MSRTYITVVSGLPRSGTSLMMRMLDAGGIPPITDGERTADEDNPRGYYEYEPVKQLAHDPSWLGNARGKAVKVISQLLHHIPADYACRVVFMQRALPEVLASQQQMLIRRNRPTDDISDSEMAALFTRHLANVEQWLATQPHMAVLYVNYNQLVQQPAPLIREVNQFLDGDLDTTAMAQAVDPQLYRQRKP